MNLKFTGTFHFNGAVLVNSKLLSMIRMKLMKRIEFIQSASLCFAFDFLG
jgi:hypothetical protein